MQLKRFHNLIPGLILALTLLAFGASSCKDGPRTSEEIAEEIEERAEEIEEQKEDVDEVNQAVHRCNEHSSKTCIILRDCAFSEKRPAKLQECLAKAKIEASCKKTEQGLCCSECDGNSCETSCTTL